MTKHAAAIALFLLVVGGAVLCAIGLAFYLPIATTIGGAMVLAACVVFGALVAAAVIGYALVGILNAPSAAKACARLWSRPR